MQEIDPNFFKNLPKCYQKKLTMLSKNYKKVIKTHKKAPKKGIPLPKKQSLAHRFIFLGKQEEASQAVAGQWVSTKVSPKMLSKSSH